MAYPQKTFIHTHLQPGSFIASKRESVWRNTLLYQLQVLKSTGRYDAFKLKRHSSYDDNPEHWPVPNHLFWDSDVAKWIEGACYLLHNQSDSEIEHAVEELCAMVASAQQVDGYLNIHYTVVEPGKRFTNLRDMHELYNAGHLIEAAVAHQHLYKKSTLFDTMVKYVDLLCATFGPGENQIHGYPGHPEIELALLRLYSITKNTKHLELVKYFVYERGNTTGKEHFYKLEQAARNEGPYLRPNNWPRAYSLWYCQAHKPILEQDTIEGHSVRAMYLLCAVADLQNFDGQQGYREACERLWRNMTQKKMYLTGGIGAIEQWEGFGIDYFLPQGTDEGGCYAETCASIGLMMMAERMLQIELNSDYSDTMELAFYNTVLGGMDCNGKEFTYVNQLASSDHDLDKRAKWFTCACCPPNVTRTLGYIGGYIWSFQAHDNKKEANIHVHLFSSAELSFSVDSEQVRLTQETNYPWEGEINFRLEAPTSVKTTVRVRIPGWASEWKLEPSPETIQVEKGYVLLDSHWLSKNPHFKLHLPMPVCTLSPHPFTNQHVTALARGPLVYCVEDVDNPWVNDHFKTLLFDSSKPVTTSQKTDTSTQETYVMLTATGPFDFIDLEEANGPKVTNGTAAGKGKTVDKLHFIPYYYRANRDGRGHMRVGLRKA